MIPPTPRRLDQLSWPEVRRQAARQGSTVLWPFGAIEQHGPHLPLDTDVIVAEGLTARLLERFGGEFDLWQLPTLSIGLSREHDWAAGTLSLSIHGFAAYLRDLAGAIVRGLPARNLAIVNGHGGNRGILENLLHELRGDFALNAVVLHPFDLAGADPAVADVHGGKGETSVMLALAPDAVRRAAIVKAGPLDPKAVQSLILERGTTWGWRSDDARLSRDGIIGDASGATAEHGAALLDRMVAAAAPVFVRLLENQKLMTR
jgi:creatinine amidohydrolase/Fe(II)-dependent formamide hydrolase-like protein